MHRPRPAYVSGSRNENLRDVGQPPGHLIGVERVVPAGLVLVEGPDPAAVQAVGRVLAAWGISLTTGTIQDEQA